MGKEELGVERKTRGRGVTRTERELTERRRGKERAENDDERESQR